MLYQGDHAPAAAKRSSELIPLVSLTLFSSLTLSTPNSCLVTVYHYSLSPSPERDNMTIHVIMTKNSSSDSFNTLDVSGSFPTSKPPDSPLTIYAKKKYKPVAQKVCLITTSLLECFHTICNIHGDPLASMPTLSPTPPPSF